MENVRYRMSEPIALEGVHDMTICAYSINGGMLPCIDLVNCYNIHITQCELFNSQKLGIKLVGCANVMIEDCCIDNVANGIFSVNGVNIEVKNNKISHLQPRGMVVRFENTGMEAAASGSSYAINNYALS